VSAVDEAALVRAGLLDIRDKMQAALPHLGLLVAEARYECEQAATLLHAAEVLLCTRPEKMTLTE
jgi:hypothetical protein